MVCRSPQLRTLLVGLPEGHSFFLEACCFNACYYPYIQLDSFGITDSKPKNIETWFAPISIGCDLALPWFCLKKNLNQVPSEIPSEIPRFLSLGGSPRIDSARRVQRLALWWPRMMRCWPGRGFVRDDTLWASNNGDLHGNLPYVHAKMVWKVEMR